MAEKTTSSARPDNDVYTVLIFVTLLALLVAVGYLWYRNAEMPGGSYMNPFHLPEDSGGRVAMVEHPHA